MPIESADDLAVFFAPDEFAVLVTYNGLGGLSALWDRPKTQAGFAGTFVTVANNVFALMAHEVPEPAIGDTIVVEATGEAFAISDMPQRSRDGAVWYCEVT